MFNLLKCENPVGVALLDNFYKHILSTKSTDNSSNVTLRRDVPLLDIETIKGECEIYTIHDNFNWEEDNNDVNDYCTNGQNCVVNRALSRDDDSFIGKNMSGVVLCECCIFCSVNLSIIYYLKIYKHHMHVKQGILTQDFMVEINKHNTFLASKCVTPLVGIYHGMVGPLPWLTMLLQYNNIIKIEGEDGVDRYYVCIDSMLQMTSMSYDSLLKEKGKKIRLVSPSLSIHGNGIFDYWRAYSTDNNQEYLHEQLYFSATGSMAKYVTYDKHHKQYPTLISNLMQNNTSTINKRSRAGIYEILKYYYKNKSMCTAYGYNYLFMFLRVQYVDGYPYKSVSRIPIVTENNIVDYSHYLPHIFCRKITEIRVPVAKLMKKALPERSANRSYDTMVMTFVKRDDESMFFVISCLYAFITNGYASKYTSNTNNDSTDEENSGDIFYEWLSYHMSLYEHIICSCMKYIQKPKSEVCNREVLIQWIETMKCFVKDAIRMYILVLIKNKAMEIYDLMFTNRYKSDYYTTTPVMAEKKNNNNKKKKKNNNNKKNKKKKKKKKKKENENRWKCFERETVDYYVSITQCVQLYIRGKNDDQGRRMSQYCDTNTGFIEEFKIIVRYINSANITKTNNHVHRDIYNHGNMWSSGCEFFSSIHESERINKCIVIPLFQCCINNVRLYIKNRVKQYLEGNCTEKLIRIFNELMKPSNSCINNNTTTTIKCIQNTIRSTFNKEHTVMANGLCDLLCNMQKGINKNRYILNDSDPIGVFLKKNIHIKDEEQCKFYFKVVLLLKSYYVKANIYQVKNDDNNNRAHTLKPNNFYLCDRCLYSNVYRNTDLIHIDGTTYNNRIKRCIIKVELDKTLPIQCVCGLHDTFTFEIYKIFRKYTRSLSSPSSVISSSVYVKHFNDVTNYITTLISDTLFSYKHNVILNKYDIHKGGDIYLNNLKRITVCDHENCDQIIFYNNILLVHGNQHLCIKCMLNL